MMISQAHFTALYLKGRPTQFKGKVTARINRLLTASSTPSPAKAIPETDVVVRTRKTSGQQNASAKYHGVLGGHGGASHDGDEGGHAYVR